VTSTASAHPANILMMFDRIPSELTGLRRFVGWRWELVDGRWTKVPYIATDPERHAKSNDPGTWRSFLEARTAW
jgi:primase-polymerase (primpol)-like protein